MKKLIFLMDQDADGYPPTGVESVWVEEDADGHFTIMNVPFFAKEATMGDVVEATSQDGELIYKTTVQRSGNSLVRIVCYRGTSIEDVLLQFENLGCEAEGYKDYKLVAVNVPPHVKLNNVQALLQAGFDEKKWDYEEPLLRQ